FNDEADPRIRAAQSPLRISLPLYRRWARYFVYRGKFKHLDSLGEDVGMKPKVLQILPMYHQAGETVLNEGADVVRTDNLDPEHLKQMVQHVEGVVLRAPAKMTSDIIRSNPRLKVISGAGVGLDNIDVQCATACAIPVL